MPVLNLLSGMFTRGEVVYAGSEDEAAHDREPVAIFTGEALVDNASGLMLELEVTCRHPAYAVQRELVRVSGLS